MYRLISGDAPPLCPSDCPPVPNPFLEQQQASSLNSFLAAPLELQAVWQGRGIAILGTATKEQAERWGKLDKNHAELTISREAQIETGEWAIVVLRYTEETIAGKIESLDRTSPVFYKLTIDTSKPLPFKLSELSS